MSEQLPKYHEVIPAIKEIVQGWGARVLDLIVPDDAVELGGGPMLDRELNQEQESSRGA